MTKPDKTNTSYVRPGHHLVITELGCPPEDLAARHPAESVHYSLARLIHDAVWDVDTTHIDLLRTAKRASNQLDRLLLGKKSIPEDGRSILQPIAANIELFATRRAERLRFLRHLIGTYLYIQHLAPGHTPPAPRPSHGPAAAPPSPPSPPSSTSPPAR